MNITDLLIALVLLLLAHAPAWSQTPPPCTHTLSSADNGVQAWVNTATAGQVLCLKAGTYRGSPNMVSVPSTSKGTAERPIVLRAEVDGTVLLDGEDSLRPLHLGGDYWRVWGIDVTRGDNHNVRFAGNHNLVERLISLDVGEGGDGAINMGGTHNTIEDCAAGGTARKQLLIGTATSGPGYNTIRRCVGLWRSNLHMSSNPTNAGELGYTQDYGHFENVILAWNTAEGGRTTEPEGLIQLFSTRHSKVLGSLFLVTRHAAFEPSRLVAATNDAGSHAQQGNYHNTTDLLWQHTVAYIDPQHPRFSAVQAYSFAEASGQSPAGQRNRITGIVGVAGQPNAFSTRSWLPPEQVQWGRTLAEAIGENKSLWTDSVAAPGICKRYVHGVLTNEPLWPMPLTERIKARTGQDVTQIIETLLGPIPAQCRTGTPIPPDPEPEPQPPLTSLSCTGELGAKGVIQMQCTPQEGARR